MKQKVYKRKFIKKANKDKKILVTSERALSSKIKKVLNQEAETKYATTTLSNFVVDNTQASLSTPFSGCAIIASLMDMSTYVINAGSGRSGVRIGNDIFVKKMKLSFVIYPNLFNNVTPTLSYCNTGESILLYFIKAKKNSSQLWPTSSSIAANQGFKLTPQGMFTPQFYDTWEIIQSHSIQCRSQVGLHSTALMTTVMDETRPDHNVVNFERTFNKSFTLSTFTNQIINMAPEDFTYIYWISYNNTFRSQGVAFTPTSGEYCQNFSCSATGLFTYTDV